MVAVVVVGPLVAVQKEEAMADVDITFSPVGHDPIPGDKISSNIRCIRKYSFH